MSLPEVPPDDLAPSHWARTVSRDEPHGLDVLEARVLAWSGRADELAKTRWWHVAWDVSPLLTLLASIGGFAAVFGNPRDMAIGRTDAPDSGDVPWAMISYGVAAIGVVLIFLFWFSKGRRRNGALLIMLALAFAFGVFGVLIAYQLTAAEGLEPGLMAMLPAYVMMALALVVFVIIALSPQMEAEADVPHVPVEELGEKAMKNLMRERNHAIKTLAERRLLPGADVTALQKRPLGELHIEEGR